MIRSVQFFVFIAIVLFVTICTARQSRCFHCRSRGDLGDCKDPFLFNATSIKNIPGYPTIVTCPSGWCKKQSEAIRGPADDSGSASDRSCMPQAPNDGEERCAEVKIRNKISRLCFCRGDLCNSAPNLSTSMFSIVPLSLISLWFGL